MKLPIHLKFKKIVSLAIIALMCFEQLFFNLTPLFAQEQEFPQSIPQIAFPFDPGKDHPTTLKFEEEAQDPTLLEKLLDNKIHKGVDFAMPEGTEILAVDDGEIIKAGEGDLGIMVKIKHSWGESVYGHLSSVSESSSASAEIQNDASESVSKGDVIGKSGSTGISTGPHLHLAIKNSLNEWVDPLLYLNNSKPISNLLSATESAELIPSASQSAEIKDLIEEQPEVLGATTEAILTPVVEDVSQNPEYLFSYKFDLDNENSVHFYDKATQRPSFAIADKDYNHKLKFFLKDASSSASPQITNDKIEFPVKIDEIPMNLRYTVAPDKIKEEFIIAENPFTNLETNLEDDLKISFDYEATDLSITKEDKEYVFRSSDGSVYWKLLEPTLEDSEGKKGSISAELNEAEKTFTLNVDSNFLKNATYPVTIDPTVIISVSSVTTATQPSTMRHIVRTSDGTLHAFVQNGSSTTTCGSAGLWWINSTDSGATWTCKSQVSSTQTLYADARADSSDHIYIVYSTATTGASTSNDVFYRKLTKGAGATWTLESAQTVLDGTSTVGYHYATLELEGTTRIWIASRYYAGTNYQVTVYYSDGLGTAPAWTQSVATLDTAGTSSYHVPGVVRFGTNMGIIYNGASGFQWRYRADTDGLTTWSSEETVNSAVNNAAAFSAVGTSNGLVFFAQQDDSVTLNISAYNKGGTWATTSWGGTAATFVSVVTADVGTANNTFWVFYSNTTGLSANLSGSRKLQYRKVEFVHPNNFIVDSSGTDVVSYHGIFDKVWVYDADAGGPYEDETTDAGDTGTADVLHSTSTKMVKDTDDAIYFGKTEKFDAMSWDISTNGSGGTIAWEYCNAVDGTPACTAWSALTLDNQPAPNFTADSWLAFTVPSDWQAAKVNSEATAYYYIRGRVSGAYTTAPIGSQMANIPLISWANAIKDVASNTTHLIWTENAASPTRLRYSSISTTPASSVGTVSTSASNNLSTPSHVSASSTITATSPSIMRHIARTSDGTLHSFVRNESSTTTCGSGGLWWLNSTDSGATWTCRSQVSATTTLYADARADSSDHIYIVYSRATTGASTSNDVFYRKLTKGAGATWTLEAEQTVLDGTSTVGYHYATLELEGTTRIWLAVRYYDGTNAQVAVYYSDGLSTAPTWTESVTTLDTAGANHIYHYPTIVRFGTNIGVIYNDQGSSGDLKWRYRADADGLTTWNTEATLSTTYSVTVPTFSGMGDSSGNVYVTANNGTVVYFSHYLSSWSSIATVSSAASSNAFVSLETDGTDVWVVYGETTGLNSGLSGSKKLVYKKGVSPFATANFDASSTAVVSYHGIFDKVWVYDADAGGPYEDETTDAGNTTSADVAHSTSTKMVKDAGDIIYFGKTAKFDALSWDLSTSGVGGIAVWEYWNGSAWVIIKNNGDFSAPSFTADGRLNFVPQDDWATTQVNSEATAYYYVRARVTTAYTTAPVGTQMAAIPLIGWANVANSTAGVYAIWTENGASPTRVRYATILSHNSAPSDPSSLGGHVAGSFTTDTTPTLSFTLSDTDGADTVKFRIQIDDSSDFSSAVVDYTSALAAQGSTSFTVGQPAGSGTYTTGSSGQTLSDGSYYWRVKAIDDDAVESSYSTANSGAIAFKIDATAPSTPDAPSTTTPTADTTPTWTWTASSDSGSGLASTPYTLQWSQSSSFASGVSSTTSTTNSFTHSTALAEGTWYFRVKAADSAGNDSSYSSNGSAVIDATLPSTPGTPSTTSPSSDTTPLWSWTASTDDGSGLATNAYTVQWCTNTSYTGCSSNTTTSTTNSFTHSTALADGTWYFRIKATDVAGNDSSYSSNGSVVIDSTGPSAPGTPSTATSPTTDTTPTWTWTASADSGSGLATAAYTVQWCTDSGFSGCSSNTAASAANSFTHSTALADGTWYFRVKATDATENDSSYSSSGSVVVDITEPDSVDLQSPSNDSYTNNDRPTFKWKAATGLSKYKFEINNGTGGDISIDNIAPSGTSNAETEKYIIQYENFSDSDSGNNYISIYTKSSSSWSAGENDGKLREGKRTWQVIAYDSADNTKTGSRTLYADFTNPTLSNVKFENLGDKNGYLIVTDFAILGVTTDTLAPSKIAVEFYRENYFLGILTSTSLYKTFTHSLDNSNNNTSLDFKFVPTADYGKYQIKIYSVDKAGNKSKAFEFDKIQYLTEASAKILFAKDKEKLKELKEQSQLSLLNLEKKAITRKEKEISELINFFKNINNDLTSAIRISQSQIKNLIASLSSISTATANTLNHFAVNIAFISQNVSSSILESEKKAIGQIAQTQKETAAFMKNIIPKIEVSNNIADGLTVLTQTYNSLNQSANDAAVQTSQSIVLLNKNISDITARSEKKTVKQVSNTQIETEHTIRTALNSLKKPINNAIDLASRINAGANSFYAIVFDEKPTAITKVTIEEIGSNYAIVSWQTNHYATGKVNYGKDLTYGKEIILEKREKHHVAKITAIKPGERIFFEVMSNGKNYTYDAYYSFETKKK